MSLDDLIADNRPPVTEGEIVSCGVDFEGKLDADELLTGTPTVQELDFAGVPIAGDLTIAGITKNTAEETILARKVAIDRAVMFNAQGFIATKSPYHLLISCSTDKGQKRQGYLRIPVVTAPTRVTTTTTTAAP